MKFSAIAVLGVLVAITGAIAQRRCGNEPTRAEVQAAESRFAAAKSKSQRIANSRRVRPQSHVIRTHFHVVSGDSTVGRGNIPDAQIQASMRVLNEDFAGSGISFVLVNTTRTVNATWFDEVSWMGPLGPEMVGSLRAGGAADLNVFVVGFTQNPTLLGYASFPWEYEGNPEADGVVINCDSVPGGKFAPFDLGKTLTHEVGHWAGLYHIFGIFGLCYDEGDFVEDTPAQSVASTGCPIGQDSCFDGGEDFVWNFMDYSHDACMTNFTSGQVERMLDHLAEYRLVF